MAFMFLTAVLLNLLLSAMLADIALGHYLDARLIEQIVAPPELPSLSPLLPNALPFLLLPNGAIPNGAFIRGTDGFVRRPDGTIPDGTSMQPEMRLPFVNPADNGDVILMRDAANELKPKDIFMGDAAGVLAQRGGDGWWHYAWNGHMLPIIAPSNQ